MQLSSSSTSSAPSKATSSTSFAGSESNAMGVKPASTITCRDWYPVGTNWIAGLVLLALMASTT